MRVVSIVLTIGMAISSPCPAWAGVYNPAEPDEGVLNRNVLGAFRLTLGSLQSIGASKVEVDPPLRKRYLLLEKLFDKIDPGKLSAEEKLNYSAVLIRRRRFADAIQLLIPATRQHADVFLLQSNLATAYHLNGDKNRARDTLKDCLDLWPKNWHDLSEPQQTLLATMGWNEGPFGFNREVETNYLKLLRLRSREPKEAESQFEAVDALFDVKFVSDDGEFEPGKISKAEKAKLPGNALEIVEQLLVWLPDDLRLQWLLGEVANAQGDIKAARKVFDVLVYDAKVRAKELMARRQILNRWNDPTPTAAPFDPDEPPPPPSTPPPQAVDWRGLTVAFVTGMLVAVFGVWQIREIRRRRQKS